MNGCCFIQIVPFPKPTLFCFNRPFFHCSLYFGFEYLRLNQCVMLNSFLTLEKVQHLPRKTRRCWEALVNRTSMMQMGKRPHTFFTELLWLCGMHQWQLLTPKVTLNGIKRKNGRRNYFSALCGGSTVECDVSSVGHNVASAWRRPLGCCFLEASVQVDRDPLNSQYLVWKRCSLWLIVNQWREY